MKRFRVMAAALCAVVLLCGFSVPAYAYADGGEGADYGDPTMTEEAPAPEPTIEPGEGFSEEGSLVTRDLLYRYNLHPALQGSGWENGHPDDGGAVCLWAQSEKAGGCVCLSL